MITFAHSGHDHSAELTQAVVASNSTANVAYVVCIVSFFVAAGILIYLLLDKIRHNTRTHSSRTRVTKPSRTSKAQSAKAAVSKKAAKAPVKKSTTKKPAARRTSKKK